MAREARSRVKKRRRGCLGGCLLRMMLLLGLAALLFVGACYVGFITINETTGAPEFSVDNVSLPLGDLSGIELPEMDLSDVFGGLSWAYGVADTGMTVKTLRAGGGEAVLVCCDGYTMLLGAGDNGLLTCAQLLLCGAYRLSAAAALSLESGQAGGMSTVMKLTKPTYLLYPDSQTKNASYNAMMTAAEDVGAQVIAPKQGLTFSLGRATVRVVGPAYENHTDERDDGLSVRVDYGDTSVLIMGAITQAGERELISSGAPLDADVLLCSRGGGEEATSTVLATVVSPQVALMTGEEPANAVKVRLQRLGCEVYTAKEHGVMTVYLDGQTVRVEP